MRKKSLYLFTTLIAMLFCFQFATAQYRTRVHTTNHNQSVGKWVNLGTTHANHAADHDKINVPGPYDYYRKLKFKVRDSPLNIQRMVVTYDGGGAPEKIETRFSIPKNGESRIIDLRGGKRKLRSIEFWYDTKGILNGKADVTVYGLR
ncbi:hypothetical protein Q4566_15285 [Tamlana sp. 2_MG-2023]|uniref:hypothetical protein n=1 Tax=unclassified Tamlana TaxID=2614803 RepID=UPI0026E3427F|nr:MULTISPECIES: hypothetical protein [unclassified Tamlana]MDO6761574.1 hypothetical protein [Tamlana sp. 2_MG-2023]MDO6792296.1 hypothetical protein [Tamlana sp. 1_MG-2023]